MEIRKSNENDLQAIMKLVHQAQSYFKSAGIDQWQDGYPQETNILEDIRKSCSYVLCFPEVIGTMYFAIEKDPNYANIDGQWLTDNQAYAVIHRIVIDSTYKGKHYASELLEFVIRACRESNVSSIRIDTHADNQSMQRFLYKNGFTLCGEIKLESGALRIAFEKILNK